MTAELKSPVVLLATVVVLSVLFSLLLVPRGVELAYLHFRNNEVDQATQDFEHLYANGDRSATTISSLIKLSLSRSDPDKAIFYLNEYIGRNPEDMTARRQLMALYREAMQPDNYVRTLAVIQEMQPTVEQARELEQLYRFSGPEDVHARMLRKLIAVSAGTADDYLMLARYDAAAGLTDEALDMLNQGTPLLLKSMNGDAAELQISLLLDRHRHEDALAVALRWGEAMRASPKPDIWLVVDMAQLFLNQGLARDALKIIEPQAQLPGVIADVAGFYVLVLVDLGRMDDGASYLARQNNGQVSLELLPAYVAIDIGRHHVEAAFARAARFPPQALSGYLIEDLARSAIDEGRPDLLAQVRSRLTPVFFHEYPLLGAMICAQDGKTADALKWLDLAEANAPSEVRDLTELEIRLGRRGAAYDRIANMAQFPENDDFIYQIASVLVQNGYAAEALPRFNRMRTQYPGTEPAWSIIAAAANGPDVVSWLSGRSDQSLTAEFLEDLSNAAAAGGNKAVMLAVARRWDKLASTSQSRLALMDAEMMNGDFVAAAALLPSIDPKSVDFGDFYDRAIPYAAKAGGPLLQTVSAYWMEQLKNSRSEADTEQAVDALAQLGQNQAILPEVKTLAEKQPAKWGPVYTDMLETLGYRDDLIAYQTMRIQDRAMSRDDRRDIGFNLLVYGAKAAAVQAFEINLETETSRSEDFDELLYLWGPRPSPDNLAWLSRRAATAKGVEKAAWLNALNDRRESTRETDQQPATPVSRADQLAEAAQDAGDHGNAAAARQNYKAALEAEPYNPARMRDLAQTEFDQKHYDAAAVEFNRYFAAGGKDPQSDFMFGDLLVRQNRSAEAKPYFQQALDQIDAEKDPPLQDMATRAELLQRLGRIEEARQQYDILIKAHPKDTAIRADYAGMLVEAGDLDAAKELVSQP